MRERMLVVTMAAAVAAFAAPARAEDKEPTAIVAIGGTGEWGLPGPTSFGPSVSVEFTPIRNWLEIEIGAATLFRRGATELYESFVRHGLTKEQFAGFKRIRLIQAHMAAGRLDGSLRWHTAASVA